MSTCHGVCSRMGSTCRSGCATLSPLEIRGMLRCTLRPRPPAPRSARQVSKGWCRQSTVKASWNTLAASFHSAVLAEWKKLRKRRCSQPHCLSTVESPKYESNLNHRRAVLVTRTVVVMRSIVVARISGVDDYDRGRDVGARPRAVRRHDAPAQSGAKSHKDQ